MKSMKHFRKKFGAPISAVMSLALVFNMLAVLPISAEWKYIWTPLTNYEPQTVFVPDGGMTTNGVPTGDWEVTLVRVAPFGEFRKT